MVLPYERMELVKDPDADPRGDQNALEAIARQCANIRSLAKGQRAKLASTAEHHGFDFTDIERVLDGEDRNLRADELAFLRDILEIDPKSLFEGVVWVPPTARRKGFFIVTPMN